MDTADDSVRLRVVVLAALAGVLAFLLPTMTVGIDEATLAGALLAVAVTALIGVACDAVVLGPRTTSVAAAARRPVPVVAARATDPTHHPLRPRAPGTV